MKCDQIKQFLRSSKAEILKTRVLQSTGTIETSDYDLVKLKRSVFLIRVDV